MQKWWRSIAEVGQSMAYSFILFGIVIIPNESRQESKALSISPNELLSTASPTLPLLPERMWAGDDWETPWRWFLLGCFLEGLLKERHVLGEQCSLWEQSEVGVTPSRFPSWQRGGERLSPRSLALRGLHSQPLALVAAELRRAESAAVWDCIFA